MKYYAGLILFFSMVIAIPTFAKAIYPFENIEQAQRFQDLTENLRCLVCQNQSLADSNAPLANDLRQKIYTMIKKSKTNSEVIHYLLARFGDFILYKPPLQKNTVFLWAAPFVLLAIGFLVLIGFISINKKSPGQGDPKC